ncbi:polysaccharide pyruvyl transferase family protein [uncultured Aquimarina sp.]|uniref:polysaccharide pyruvyl transferase family protein n=1 Tax=uncultured Aquimarina sp. TaxID=575652 RepID=UPI00260FE3A7|nr:polysaccharide pyruvyl transferase family protein [uncultured Aquimarina sp.]
MKVMFDGYYGYQNSGDDAFVEVSSWGANTYWKSSKNLFIGKNLPETLSSYSGIETKIKGMDRAHTLVNSLKVDYFISSGGSTFNNYNALSNRSFAIRAGVFNKKLKLGAIGVSLGPFKNTISEKKVTAYLKDLDFLALRDTRSFDIASSLNLPYTPIKAFDLAALLPKIYETKILHKVDYKKTIAVSICNYESYVGGDLNKERLRNDFFKKLLTLLSQNPNIHFKIFIINGHKVMGDIKASLQLISNIHKSKVTIIPYLQNVKKTWDQIANCDFVLSTRLHASIFGCYANVPFMLLEYHKKCSDFLKDVGQSNKYRLYDGDVDVKNINNTIQNILFGHEKYHKPTQLGATIEMAQKNFTETIKLHSL